MDGDVFRVAEGVNQASDLEGNGRFEVDSALGFTRFDSRKKCDSRGGLLIDILKSLDQAKSSCGLLCNYPGRIEGPNLALRGRKVQGHVCAQRIPVSTLLQIVEICKSFRSFKDDGTRILEVVEALVKVATETSVFAPRSESVSGVLNKAMYDDDHQRRKDTLGAVQSVVDFALEEKRSIYVKLRPSGRLRIWRIRPSCFKQDISSLAEEAMLRLLLPLDKELSQREEWAILVVCLRLAPEMFTEARRLLHDWLLSSGSVRLWELRAQLTAAVWDVASHPSAWGNENHLPPRFALYCVDLRPFLQVLEETPTTIGLLRIVKLLDAEMMRCQPAAFSSGMGRTESSTFVHHNSIWSLLMECLPWFIFASRLLFRDWKQIEGDSESLISLAKSEGFALDYERESVHVSSQVAARYIAWIISPADHTQRGCAEQLLLMTSSTWGSVVEAACRATSPLSAEHDFRALKAAVQASYLKCTSCGSPVDRTMSLADEGVEGIARGEGDKAVNNREKGTLQAVRHWLAEVRKNFGRSVNTSNSHGEAVASRTGETSLATRDDNVDKKAYFLVQFLPLAALSESLTSCNIYTIVAILHFVASSGSRQSDDNDHAKKTDFVSECCSCEARHPATSPLRKKRRVSSSACGQESSRRSLDWVYGAGAVFSCLDALDGDVLSLGSRGQCVGDLTGHRRRVVTDHLAVVVSEFVKEWGNSLETFLSEASSPLGEKNSYSVLLEDLHCRFCRWTDTLDLSPEAKRLCAETKQLLDIKIMRALFSFCD
ncbi:hypothetical protein MPTK1_1g09340 [Marchantia polymorpha subsp. ruderalis]|uniref:Uncharacterized protein n=2 Tax=Marchantia polymorpha TaxID=3197 RepID=A0AAF6AN86_MARPO|nr:hypothetical protein MARPO_0096s0065 [Marchantia polymorpha]BBM97906.1 hypothetical protein Mp_1g09340 [Marchantia polymorpha subsp. ruderalis]|eukprot:PTQ32722.1 hypothetical protein MARPO_0096s0065 [Marchantia polymorpha]